MIKRKRLIFLITSLIVASSFTTVFANTKEVKGRFGELDLTLSSAEIKDNSRDELNLNIPAEFKYLSASKSDYNNLFSNVKMYEYFATNGKYNDATVSCENKNIESPYLVMATLSTGEYNKNIEYQYNLYSLFNDLQQLKSERPSLYKMLSNGIFLAMYLNGDETSVKNLNTSINRVMELNAVEINKELLSKIQKEANFLCKSLHENPIAHEI